MTELKTLKEIFETCEGHEIVAHTGNYFLKEGRTVEFLKGVNFSWEVMNKPEWRVNKKPREWALTQIGTTRDDSLEIVDGTFFVDGPNLERGERVRVREVLEGE